MPYIPENHKKYNLLPWCVKHGREAFEYPGDIICRLEDMIPDVNLFPYNYESYEEYYSTLDSYIERYNDVPETRERLEQFKSKMIEMNQKEEWSVLRYIGPSCDSITGLTYGKTYYWPTQISNPIYHGVIDNEEFTSYLYPTEREYWEILEDPTGMAYRTIYEGGKGAISIKEHEQIMLQFSEEITCE